MDDKPSAVEEASRLLKELAEPRPAADSVKAAITRAARLCGLKSSRAEDIWRKEARMVRSEEMDAIRQACRKHAEAEVVRLRARLKVLEMRKRTEPETVKDE